MDSTHIQQYLIITIDIEDWPQSTWDHSLDITERAAYNTNRILEILNQYNHKVTMFVLGKFAQLYPEIVKRISSNGHEVASHGYGHVEVFKQSPTEFRCDVIRSKDILEDILGKPVIGYRAPDYSITTRELWALDILAELGFEYDSSIFPSDFTRYGIPDWPPYPTRINLPSGRTIVEFPFSIIKLFKMNIPIAGGGYHRLLPSWMIQYLMRSVLNQYQYFMNYCHPYEFDPEGFSEIDIYIPLITKLHQGLGRRRFKQKFENILKNFQSFLIADILKSHEWVDYKINELEKKHIF